MIGFGFWAIRSFRGEELGKQNQGLSLRVPGSGLRAQGLGLEGNALYEVLSIPYTRAVLHTIAPESF